MTEERIAINNYIKECEKNGTFDIHTTSPDLELSLPVDESFEYIKKGMKHWIPNFIMKTAGRKKEEDILKNTFQLKIVGKENLNNISNSIVICNHVHMFDCVIVRHAFKHKNLYITAAEFNNRSDALGFYMRYMGMMPFSSNHQAMKNMHRAMQKILHAKKGHILFYPEASEWLY